MSADDEARELLPCSVNCQDNVYSPVTNSFICMHWPECPWQYRPAIAARLAERDEKLGQAMADLMGCRDGALVRDLRVALAAAEERAKALLDALTRVQDASANQGFVIEIARAAIIAAEQGKE